MADTPVPFNTFRGLNLRDAPDSVGDQCIDCLNIDLDRSGTKVRNRDGYDALNASAYGGRPYSLHRQDSTRLLAGVTGSALYSIAATGVATSLATSIDVYTAVNFGTPSTTSTYVSAVAKTLRRVVGTTYTSPTATVDGVAARSMPIAKHLAVQDADNRLVVSTESGASGPNGATSSTSHVWFSEAGNAEAWTSTNYVQLTPGDGEVITGVVAWRGNIFVFKETRLFIFYGNSTDASGNPVFNYRVVQLPSRVVSTGQTKAFATGEGGVYYVAYDGVYVTTGDVPTLLSGELYPLGTDEALPSTFTALSGARFSTFQTLHFHKRRLFVVLAAAGGNPVAGTLVYDIDSDNWFVWSISPAGFVTWDAEDASGLLYFGGGNPNYYLYRFKSSYTTDGGSNINSYYRTGFYDLGDGDQKTIHNVDIWGTGTINYSSARDFNATMGTARSVTLGTSPAIGYGRTQPSADTARGNLFSHKFAGSGGGAWSVQRVVQNVQAKRPAGPKGT